MEAIKGRHGSGNKGNFESGQNKIKACSYLLKDRECNPLFVTMDALLSGQNKSKVCSYLLKDRECNPLFVTMDALLSGQNKSKVCSYLLKDRECNPLFVTMEAGCKLYFRRDNVL